MEHEGCTVLLSDAEESPSLAAHLGEPDEGPVPMYRTLEELVTERPLSSIDVLVVHCHPTPKGVLLAKLGRLNLEYPRMQKVAVLDGPLPRPVAEYLTACGVDLVTGDTSETAMGQLMAVMDRVHERTGWIAG
jgi:hypothetical protein